MINENCLRLHGAVLRRFTKGALIYGHGQDMEHYFQIVDGVGKLVITKADGQEQIYRFLRHGDGMYSIFTGLPMPFDAVAITDCSVLFIPKDNFLSMIKWEKGIMPQIMKHLSLEIYACMELNRIQFTKSPTVKIQELFNLLKYEQTDQEIFSYEIILTMQQIAYMTGLNLEITRATMQQMLIERLLKLENGRFYF